MRKILLNLKLRTKFLLSYIIIILFAISMITIVNYNLSTSTLKNNTSQYSEYLMEQLGANLEYRTTDIENYIFLQFNNSGLNIYLRYNVQDDGLGSYQKNKSVDSFMYNLMNSKEYIKNAFIIDKYGNKFFKSKDNSQNKENEIVKNMDSEKVKGLWGQTLWIKGDSGEVYMERAVFDPENTEYLGIIVVGVSSDYLRSLYANINKVSAGRIVLLDGQNNIMVADDQLSENITEFLKKGLLKDTSSFNAAYKYEGSDYISNVRPSGNGKWKILNIITVKELTKSSNTLKFWIFVTCIVSVLIAMAVAVFISKRITEKIRLLIKNIKIIAQGNFNTRIQLESQDEIGVLAAEFNSMAENINNLIQTVYSEQLLKKNAEFKALQSEYNALQAQINPHFLYNTLETISSMAKLKNEPEISMIVYLLADLLRETISEKKSIIFLEQELSYIRNYLEIQKRTYGQKMDFEYDIDEEALVCKVPKFILQPVVENAIVHGLQQKPGKGLILINGFIKDNRLIIEIIDNGIGMKDEEVAAILDYGDDTGKDGDNRHTRIGVRSVDKRIKILYGSEYGLKIFSKPGEGTKIEITLPIIGDDKQLKLDNK
jgi:two-component system sensor histidine kinase YesM